MSFNSLFRKKSVQDILKQVEKNEAEGGHGSLGKHLGVRDLTAFGIAAIIGAGIFSTIGKASADGGPAVIFCFYLLLLLVVLLHLRMPNLLPWFLFLVVRILILMLLLAN